MKLQQDVKEDRSVTRRYDRLAAACLQRTRRKKIMPARGPRRDLWVVVVTMSAYLKGVVSVPAATRPLHAA